MNNIIKELQREKILTKRTNVAKSVAIGNLVDRAKKMAKADNREADEKDIIQAAKVLIKENQKTIDTIMHDDIEANDFISDKYSEEIVYLKEYLPQMVSEDELVAKIAEMVSKLDDDKKNMKSMGVLISQIKELYGDAVDMAIASKSVKKALS